MTKDKAKAILVEVSRMRWHTLKRDGMVLTSDLGQKKSVVFSSARLRMPSTALNFGFQARLL